VSDPLDRDERRVTGVTLSAGRHQAVTSDGVVPMLMLATDATDWLVARGLGPVRSASEIHAQAANLRLRIGTCRRGRDAEPWVKSITLSES
jgi:hypothetical protein